MVDTAAHPPQSQSTRILAALEEGPRTAAELSDLLSIALPSVHAVAGMLRRKGLLLPGQPYTRAIPQSATRSRKPARSKPKAGPALTPIPTVGWLEDLRKERETLAGRLAAMDALISAYGG